MKQWIRWSGLAGFIVIAGLLTVIWMFALGPGIKWAIEFTGQELVGAKVNVDEVDVSFSPLGLTINRIQITDPEAPMTNMFEIATVNADIELLPLFLGKSIINDMSVQGVQVSTPRETSGALTKEEKQSGLGKKIKDSTKDASDGAEKTLPSAQEILAKEELQTEIKGKAFQANVKAKQKEIDDALNALPNENSAKQYEKEINQLFTGRFKSLDDFKQRQKALKELQKRIKADQQAIANAKKVVNDSKKELTQQWDELKDAPEEDYARISSKYQMNTQGAANLSRLIFGNQVGDYADKARYWYKKAEPYIGNVKENKAEAKAEKEEQKAEAARSGGRDIFYPTDRPLPDFWIKNTQVSAILPIGNVNAVANNITTQQKVIGSPITAKITGEKLHQMKSLNADIEINELTEDSIQTATLNMTDIAVKDMDVGMQKLKLVSSNLQVNAMAKLTNGVLKADGAGLFEQAKFSSSANTLVAKEMVLALAKIPQFTIDAKAKGDPLKPKLEVTSDLDTKLQSAFNQRLNEKQKELEVELKKKLNDKLMNYAGDYKDQLAQLNLAEGSLGDKQKALSGLADKEMSSFEEQQKREAKEKLEAEKRKARAKAEAEKKKKQKELEKKAKEKLKNLF